MKHKLLFVAMLAIFGVLRINALEFNEFNRLFIIFSENRMFVFGPSNSGNFELIELKDQNDVELLLQSKVVLVNVDKPQSEVVADTDLASNIVAEVLVEKKDKQVVVAEQEQNVEKEVLASIVDLDALVSKMGTPYYNIKHAATTGSSGGSLNIDIGCDASKIQKEALIIELNKVKTARAIRTSKYLERDAIRNIEKILLEIKRKSPDFYDSSVVAD